MKWSIRFWFILVGILILQFQTANGFKLAQQDTAVFNRMICENEKLQIDCKKPDTVLNIQRAYYGRYSITPCNKNHIQYTMGCTANNTLEVLRELCQGKQTCSQNIVSSLFKIDECPGVGELEINYLCVTISDDLKEDQLTTSYNSEQDMSSSNNYHQEEKTSVLTDHTITDVDQSVSTQNQHVSTAKFSNIGQENLIQTQQQCLFSENPSITENFKFGNHATALNQYINIPCSADLSENLSGTKLFQCRADGKFHFVNSTCFQNQEKWIEIYEKQLDEVKTDPVVVIGKINKHLQNDRAEGLDGTKESLEKVVNLIKNASSSIYLSSQKVDRFAKVALVETADTLIEKKKSWKEMEKSDRSKSATKLLDVVEGIIFQKMHKNNDDKKDFSMNTKNIAAEVTSNDELKSELSFPSDGSQLKTSETAFVKIEKPDKSQKFMFVVYKGVNDLFLSNNDLVNEKDIKNNSTTTNIDKNIIINSNIISFKMNHNSDIDYLKKAPIQLTFKHLDTNSDFQQHEITPICSYWDYNKDTYDGGHWSSEGCNLHYTNITHTVCHCNHLTHFAILMDIHGVHEELPEFHQLALTLITIISSVISCISIILTLLAFRFLKIIKKNREHSTTKDLTTITSHLCFCLLASLTMFLAGIAAQKLKAKLLCTSIALFSHYFFLCSFFWMLLEGIQLYFMLVRIFILDKSPIKRFCLVGYGLPFLIVLSSKIADILHFDSLGYGTSSHCWLSTYRGFNLTFIVPVSVILVANFFMLIIVVYGMRNIMASRQTKLNQKQDDFFKSLFGFWCVILTLLGLPWLIGYFILDTKSTLLFSYLFTILNSSQGTIIFLFHCVVSRNVREELLKICRKKKRSLFSSKQSAKTGSLLCYPTSTVVKHHLQRGPSDSSSFNKSSPRKFFDSVRLIDRKSSNCSSSHSNSQRLANNRRGSPEKSFLGFIFQIFCSCFMPAAIDSSTPIITTNTTDDVTFNKNIKQSHSFSTNSRNESVQSPPRNYSVSLTRQGFSSAIKDEDCANLLQQQHVSNITDPGCYNCQNLLYLNKDMPNNNPNQTLLQLYLTNEATKNLYSQKCMYAKINRNSSYLSNCSNTSNNPTQTTYLSPLNTSYINNRLYVNNCTNCHKLQATSCQIPNMPPPPPPPYTNITQFCGVNSIVPPSTASILRKKDSFKSSHKNDRFGSFKASEISGRLPPVPSRKDEIGNDRVLHEENQYLQPECNTYSMVDSEFQSESQYYCDDDICGQDLNSNMYSEVFEDYMEEPNSSIGLCNYKSNNSKQQPQTALNIRNKLNASYFKNLTSKQSTKLKDLIAMPEEYDKEESIEHSNISDQDLFNLTSSVIKREKRMRMQDNNDLLELEEVSSSETASSNSDSLRENLNFQPASAVLNGLFPPTSLYSTSVEDNDKAKKILENY